MSSVILRMSAFCLCTCEYERAIGRHARQHEKANLQRGQLTCLMMSMILEV